MRTPVTSPAAPRELSLELDMGFAEHLRAVRAAQRHGLARGREIRLRNRVTAVVGTGALLWLLYADDRALGTADGVLLLAVAAICLSPLMTALHVWMARRTQTRPLPITLSDEGIAASDAQGSTRMDWAAVHGVHEDGEFLLLDLGPAAILPLPLRLLRAPGVLEQARALIARGRAAAAGEPAAEPSAEAPGVWAEFTPALGNRFAAFLHIWYRSRLGRWMTAILLGLAPALLAIDARVMGLAAVRGTGYLVATGAAAALLLVPALGLFWSALDLRSGGRTPVRMTLDDAGLTQQARGGRATVPWSEVRRVQRTGGMLLFWTGPSMAQYLPLRALGAAEAEARRVILRHAGDRAAL